MDAPFNRQPFNKPLTFRALRKLALALGWKEQKKQGKGSHRVFTRKGYREVTLPCHGDAHEYARGLTRQFLKQLLEPLNDVCPGAVEGVYEASQVEQILDDVLAYLPAQMQGECDRAIAEMKAAVDKYRIEQQLRVDDELAAYEEQKLLECDQTIAALAKEQTDSSQGLNVMLAGCLIHQRQEYQALSLRQRSLAQEYDQQHAALAQAKSTQQALESKLENFQAEAEILKTEKLKIDQDLKHQIKSLQRLHRRDRLIIWGLLALSVTLGVGWIYQSRSEQQWQKAHRRSSPQTISSHYRSPDVVPSGNELNKDEGNNPINDFA